MVPPCEAQPAHPGADWILRLEEANSRPQEEVGAIFADRPVLVLPHGGPRLAVLDAGDGWLRAIGRYRPYTGAAMIDVDAARMTTHVVLPANDELGGRWADWLARTFFASRMLASGWQMLHASAVVINRRALLFVAGSRGGKSTLAYRARSELGAVFLADDLVLIGPGRTVVGWPTRIAIPEELITGVPAMESERRRIIFSPSDLRSGTDCSGPAPLGAVVIIKPGGREAPSAAHTDEREALGLATDIPGQRLHTSDLLGLMGRPQVTCPGLQFDGFGDAPVIELRIGDMAALPTAGVWAALSGLLSYLEES
ncbi:hypothetical protein Pth03_12090 [Planotetraspora thailandica]|uniref:Serine kinase n=2 Tax=Planotetraspora thailandica TaxID=487172 RepID=A0A8J3XU70_9ACTN|nr:hypothetical protein Pth03_12090 [Planotetraspora thailandica]